MWLAVGNEICDFSHSEVIWEFMRPCSCHIRSQQRQYYVKQIYTKFIELKVWTQEREIFLICVDHCHKASTVGLTEGNCLSSLDFCFINITQSSNP